MKYEFIQMKGSFKDKENLNKLELWGHVEEKEVGKVFNVLLLDNSSKMRDRTETIASLLAEIMQLTTLNKAGSKGDKLTVEGIQIEQAQMLRMLGRFLGYFFGSTSWRENELQDYDKYELLNRLEIIKNFFK